MKPKTPARSRNRRPNREQDPVEVYCRVRPIDDNYEKCCAILTPNVLQLSPPEGSQSYKNGQYKEMQYTYQFVFDEVSSQKAVFDHVAMPLVEDILLGKNGLLFTYGITSSGKTHTMTGSAKEQGILPRTLDVIFNSIQDLQAKKYVFMPDKMNGFDVQSEADAMIERQRRDIMPKLIGNKTPGRGGRTDEFDLDGERVKEQTALDCVEDDNNYAVFVSYAEIYNNYIYDLLEELPYDPITGFKAPQSKILREDVSGNMYVHNCTETEVKSTEEAYDVLIKVDFGSEHPLPTGQKRRKVAHTALNAESSRSHSVFNIRLVQAPLDVMGHEVLQQKEKVTISQLSLVDLAGSERLSRTKNAGDRMREAGNINQSLMALRTCFEYLRENQNGSNKMVPYRDSRLTHLFKNYFDGEGKVRMVVCVNPNAEEYDETLQVMRFAEITQEIMVTRAEQMHHDAGLAPGRRKMARDHEHVVQEEEPDVTYRIYDMGPPIPEALLQHPSNDAILTTLLQHLQSRDATRQHLVADLSRRQDVFRAQLMEVEGENRGLQTRVQELENLVDSRSTDKSRLERKVRSLEKQLADTSGVARQLELENRELKSAVDSTSDSVKRERTEKNRLRSEHTSKIQNLNRQWEDALLRQRQQSETEASSRLLAKDRKLKLVKSIIDGSSEGSDAEPRGSAELRTRMRAPLVAPKPRSRITPARSDTSLNTCGTTSASSASRLTRPTTRLNNRMKSPPPAPKPIPVVNPRHHRRSRSHGDELWIDHRSNKNVELNTVLQPKMKKKKSVTALNAKDTREASKYCLTHQLQDSDGELKTQLYKGDVLPTAGGGQAVIFNDVETLRQTSPGDRKRRPSAQRPEDYEGEWTDTETRCHVALEGHGPKRSRTQVHV